MHKAQLKIIGLVTVLIYLVFGLAALIMSGINFQVLHVQWSEGPWTHLAPIELAVTIYLVVTAIVGVLTFTVCSPNKGVIMFVSTYTLITLYIMYIVHCIGCSFFVVFISNRNIRFNWRNNISQSRWFIRL